MLCLSPSATQGLEMVARAVWETRHLYVMIAGFLLAYSWIAAVLYADCWDVGGFEFDTYEASFKQMFVLLTTSNYPDISTVLVNDFRPNFLFFFVFVVIGVFLFMNLILSDLYSAYHKVLKAYVLGHFQARESGIQSAFYLLASTVTSEEVDGSILVVALPVWRIFYSRWLPRVMKSRASRSMADAIFEFVQKHSLTDAGLDQDEFCALVMALSDKDMSRAVHQAIGVVSKPTLRSSTSVYHAPSFVTSAWSAVKKICGYTIEPIIDGLLCVNIFLLWIETQSILTHIWKVHMHNEVWQGGIYYASNSWTEPWLDAFTVFWTLELTLRVLVKGGLRSFWFEGNMLIRRIEVIVVFLTSVLDLWGKCPFLSCPPNFYKYLILARLLRSSRLFLRRASFQSFLRSLSRTIPALSVVINIILVVHLIYAEIGVQLFGGVLRTSNSALHDTVWTASSYWSNNFNCLSSAVMVLFQQLVVNNWFVVMDACVAALGDWCYLYFMSHYVLGVTVLMNFFTAFVIEVWHVELDQAQREPGKPDVTMQRAITQDDWAAIPSSWHVLRTMFAEEIHAEHLREKTCGGIPSLRTTSTLLQGVSSKNFGAVPGLARALGSSPRL